MTPCLFYVVLGLSPQPHMQAMEALSTELQLQLPKPISCPLPPSMPPLLPVASFHTTPLSLPEALSLLLGHDTALLLILYLMTTSWFSLPDRQAVQ